MERTPLPAAVRVGTHVILDIDAPVIWFTFDEARHDIGLFHTAAGVFTGCYANMITPVRFRSPLEWETTDLFLDLWLPAGSDAGVLLDEDELNDALEQGWISPALAHSARVEAQRLLSAIESGEWPPAIVTGWSLERALRRIGSSAANGGTRGEQTV
jgi:predicted RNA-binding protein associated with RNAse of E/G family